MDNTRILELYIESFGDYTNVTIQDMLYYTISDEYWVDVTSYCSLKNMRFIKYDHICLDGNFKKFKRKLLIKDFIENEVG